MSRSLGPFLEVARIQSEINRLFESLLDLGDAGESDSAWIPNIDVLERPDRLVVRIELPGVEPGNLAVSVHGGDLIIRGEKRKPGPKPITADFLGVEVPDRFVFGCGLDAYGSWRNLPAIYALKGA